MHKNDCCDGRYLQEQLITYIGNKRALLPFIADGLDIVKKRLRKEKLRTLDLFSGTGIVSRLLKAHSKLVISNDIEYYSYVTNKCYMANKSHVPMERLSEAYNYIIKQAALQPCPGFIAELYAPSDDSRIMPGERAFYTRRNAVYIDTVRRLINTVDADLRFFLIAPLLSEASIHTNTAGVFKGFYKSRSGSAQFGGEARNALSRILKNIELKMPIFSDYSCDTAVYNDDAYNLMANYAGEELDLIYLDPPYNQHPYGSNYFMLNLISTYERPEHVSKVSGIPKIWNRSAYNRKTAAQSALFRLVELCRSKFILISYNSEGFIEKKNFVGFLSKIGKLTVLETPYNTFKGSRNLAARPKHVTEFLYLLEKK